MSRWIRLVLLVGFVLGVSAPTLAYKEFQNEFVNTYAKGKGADKAFSKLTRRAKCYVCHQGKEDRKNCNAYGEALAELLDKGDKKDKEKIVEALGLVSEMPSDATDPSSPRFGELISRGELPGGPLEESKKEPEPANPKEPAA